MLGRLAMWAIPVVVGAVALAVYLTSGRFSSTDNAYVKGERVQVAAEVSGPIVAISIVENQRVRRGDKLLQIDPRPYEIVLARSQAEMQAARSEIMSLKVAYRQKQEEIKSAGSQLAYAQAENLRQSELAQRKVASQQRAEEAKRDLDIASQRVAMLNEELARVVVALFGDPDVPLEQHPRVRGAMAARDEAQLNLARTRVLAPIDGIVSRKPTVGAYAAAGSPLLAVVADDGLWVEANFKETDLTRVRPGQAVTIRIDSYPDHVWHGTVGSISQATGAEFALLPPQNASGNWVKVVQRIPVRIEVPVRPSDPPLRLGMSATVDIDTGHQRSLTDVWLGIARALGGDAAAGTPQATKR
jgi:membrane fusion protein (multidrug efflux system)